MSAPPRQSRLRRLPRLPLIHSFWFSIPATLVILGLNAFNDLATRTQWGDDLAIVSFALFGIVCIENDRASRKYHGMMSGPGFLLVAVAMILRDTGIVDHGFGVPYPVFAAAALLGHTLAWRYRRRTRSTYRLV